MNLEFFDSDRCRKGGSYCSLCQSDDPDAKIHRAAWTGGDGERWECPKGYLSGLGDVIAKVTKAAGVKPCGGCKKRQAMLNRLVPLNRPKE